MLKINYMKKVIRFSNFKHPFFLLFICVVCVTILGFSSATTNNSDGSNQIEIYVSDAGNFNDSGWKILKYDENGKNPVVYISQDQKLAWPQDIVFLEDQGVVLISNLNSGTINRHNISDGTYIDSFATEIGGPTRMKIGSDNLLYVLQWAGNGKVLRYQLDGTFVDEFTSTGVLNSIGLDWDSEGNLYVSSFNNGSDGFVRKFDTSGNDLGLFISSTLEGPTNISFDNSGNLLVNDWKGNKLRKFDSKGTFIKDLFSMNRAEGIGLMPNGDILIGNGNFINNPGTVTRHNSEGSYIEDIITSEANGGLMNPNAVVIREVKEN